MGEETLERAMTQAKELRPERGAGGYAHDDSTVAFYLRVNSLISPASVVCDLGAGRGAELEKAEEFPRSLRRLKGRVAHLAACDVDRAVLENSHVDEARLIDSNGRLPYADESFDLVYSDWVVEHVEDVGQFASEVYRVLKPSGWFCARTTNKWGYIGIGARIIPAFLESRGAWNTSTNARVEGRFF